MCGGDGSDARPCVKQDLAILVAMAAADEHLPLATVKNRLSEVVDRLEREHGRVVITKHGRPAAVVMSVEDLEGLEETLNILSDPRLMRRIRKADAEIASGEAEELTVDQALALVKRQH
jgi:antitoxin YefM